MTAVAIVVAFVLFAAPPHQLPPTPPQTGYEREAMHEAMAVDRFAEQLDAILAQGSRYTGQPGNEAVRDLIAARWADAGLEVIAQPFEVVTPFTVERTITEPDGLPIGGVTLYPFLPNHFQPQVTPPQGLAGRLILVDDQVRLEHEDFRDAFAVVDAASPPEALGLDWSRYAQLGFQAVILTHSGGLDAITWTEETVRDMSDNSAANFVRLAATPSILDYLGQEVRLDVQTQWRTFEAHNLVGVLRARADGEPTREAVVVITHYDSYAYLPDHAPGVRQAYSLASQANLLEGLRASVGSMNRDVIMVATAAGGQADKGTIMLHSAIGPRQDPATARRQHEQRLAEAERHATLIAAIRECFSREGFFIDADVTSNLLAELPPGGRAFFEEQFNHVMSSVAFELSEPRLQARLKFLRAGGDPDQQTDEYAAYLDQKKRYETTTAALGIGPVLLLRDDDKQAVLDDHDVRKRLAERFETLEQHEAAKADRAQAALQLNAIFASYDEKIVVVPHIVPTAGATVEKTTLFMGFVDERYGTDRHRQEGPAIAELMTAAAPTGRDPLADRVEVEPLSRQHAQEVDVKLGGSDAGAAAWNNNGYTAFAIVNTDRPEAYSRLGAPFPGSSLGDPESVEGTLRVLGDTVLSLAQGNGWFQTQAVGRPFDIGGRVLVGGIGRSIVPDYAVAGALVGSKGHTPFASNGKIDYLFLQTDPYGHYWLGQSIKGLQESSTTQVAYSPNATLIGDGGVISYIKDEGRGNQAIFQSSGLDIARDGDQVNIVMFRASPVAVFDMLNPRTMKPFSGVDFLDAAGIAPLDSLNVFSESRLGIHNRFTPPEVPVYVTFRAGAEDNELAQTTRAFMLGLDQDQAVAEVRDDGRIISGPGYLPANHSALLDIPSDIARSMAHVNGQRLDLLERYGMADERTKTFHDRSASYLELAETEGAAELTQTLAARDAVSYAELNHPVLRGKIREAVVSIIWYLCLLVPFVFFVEKLVFGFNDVRKQLATVAIVFLLAFTALRLLHPAFSMIRSSLMVLLGFIIILIAGGITILFSGKFKENFEQLRAKRGQATEADVNTMGVIGTAFMLGLNNMHRRKVRTGLTCGTLVLITFAMICFTSIRSDLVDTEIALGKAHYQGLLVKNPDLAPISDSQLFALRTRFGHLFDISTREMVVGGVRGRETVRPDLRIDYKGGRSDRFHSVLLFDQTEPLADQLSFTTDRGWFDAATAEQVETAEVKPVILPDTMADQLQITPERVDRERVEVTIEGVPFWVYSLIEAESLASLTDVDGRDLLPFDVTAMKEFQLAGDQVVVSEPFVRVPPDDLLIALDLGSVKTGRFTSSRLTSVAVQLSDSGSGDPLPYKEAREQISTFLEKSGEEAYYGLDGVAYRGLIARRSSFSGLVDLIIPLVIAAMTVLNTIKGSVYERRDEIFVYNAVGIAPRYVFFMFIAEAFVYAVVGSVAGYLLSQGVGRALTELGLTGGLNMTFASTATIYASLAIMIAVFGSTLFPALSAMEIAAPAEDSGWDMPEPEGDELTIRLPFTFDREARLAVLDYFYRFFDDHGEGSSGAFFCGDTQMGVAAELDELADQAYIPELTTTVWLKPFDLGVSQRLAISMPTDPETGEYIAVLKITRLSGTRESWVRLNRRFMRRLRKHFLHWRAVGPEQRHDLFGHARRRLTKAVTEEGVGDG